MAKSKSTYAIATYGIYGTWDKQDKSLPKLQQYTTDVPAIIDIEFGFILKAEKAKGKKLRYCIYHPGILDDFDQVRPPFDGEVYIKQNSWKFYLGDTIWAPINDKLGEWRMVIEVEGDIVAEKTFTLMDPKELDIDLGLKRYGY